MRRRLGAAHLEPPAVCGATLLKQYHMEHPAEQQQMRLTGDSHRPLFHRRPACVAALGVLIGLMFFALFGAPGASAAGAGAGLIVLLLLLLASLRLYRPALLPLLFAVLAFLSAALQCPAAPEQTAGYLTGRVAETPEHASARTVLVLKDAALDGAPIRGRVELIVHGSTRAEYGQHIGVHTSLWPSDADWLAYDRSLGIAAHAAAGASALAYGDVERDAYGALLEARAAIADRIGALFPAHPDVACGLLLGGRLSHMDAGVLSRFRAAGIAHLLAVSGLHVGILAAALLVLLRLIRPLWLRFSVFSAFLLAYAALTAFTPSVLRASVMLLCVLPAMPLRRRTDLPSSLSLAFVLVLLLRPFALGTAGFQLSFSAILGLALLAPVLKARFSVLGERAAAALSSSIAVLAATVPPIASFFGELPLASVAANLLILPLLPLFLVPAAAALPLSCLSLPLGRAVAALPAAVLDMLLRVAAAGGTPHLRLFPPSPLGALLLYAAILLASPLFLVRPRTKALLAGLCAAACFLFWR